MGIKSLIQISDNLYIPFSLDKTTYFWNLIIIQEIIEEPETKDKKRKKKEENKYKERGKEKDKEKDKDKEEGLNHIIISLNCIGQINNLNWLTNSVLFFPIIKSEYVGNQDKNIKIYRILNYNDYQNYNKITFIFKNVGFLKGHNS